MKKTIDQTRLELARKASTATQREKDLEADNARLRKALAEANAKIEKQASELSKYKSQF